jgi:hypothetical protein
MNTSIWKRFKAKLSSIEWIRVFSTIILGWGLSMLMYIVSFNILLILSPHFLGIVFISAMAILALKASAAVFFFTTSAIWYRLTQNMTWKRKKPSGKTNG